MPGCGVMKLTSAQVPRLLPSSPSTPTRLRWHSLPPGTKVCPSSAVDCWRRRGDFTNADADLPAPARPGLRISTSRPQQGSRPAARLAQPAQRVSVVARWGGRWMGSAAFTTRRLQETQGPGHCLHRADRQSGDGAFLTGFLVGGAVFGTLGFLFAPQVRLAGGLTPDTCHHRALPD